MTTRFTVRRAVRTDVPRIKQLNQMLFENDRQYDETYNMDWPNENPDYYLQRVVGSDGAAFAADAGGRLVGYCIGHLERIPSFRMIRTRAELENIFVEEDFRSSGVGTALVSAFIEWARAHGADVASVTASAQNTRAVAFYRKSGFKDYETTLEMPLRPGAAKDADHS